jgi:hypothetical protein
MDILRRGEDDTVHKFVNPYKELNIGLWSLFAGASVFLSLRIWVKLKWRYGLWYDDYVLLLCWVSINVSLQNVLSRLCYSPFITRPS